MRHKAVVMKLPVGDSSGIAVTPCGIIRNPVGTDGGEGRDHVRLRIWLSHDIISAGNLLVGQLLDKTVERAQLVGCIAS